MVLQGQVNPQLVAAINVHGRYAVGISGVDAGLIRAVARDPELGFVGDVTEINPEVILGLIDDEFIPVIATIGSDIAGQAYNINADTVAGAIAEALGAEKLVYLTDIEGLRRDVDDPASLIRQTTADELDSLDRRRHDRRRNDPEGRQLHPCRAQRCASSPHPRRSDRARAAARGLHRRRHRHDGHATTTSRPNGTGASLMAHEFDHEPRPELPVHAGVRRPVDHVRARAPAPSSGTPTASATSTSSPGSPSCRSATPIRSSPRRSPTRRIGCCTCRTSSPTPSPPRRRSRSTSCCSRQRAGRARSSSPTPAPSRTSAPSSWPANTADADATRSSARSAASTGARWRRSRRPGSRPSTSRSSRCRKASATSRGATSTRCGQPSTVRSRRC